MALAIQAQGPQCGTILHCTSSQKLIGYLHAISTTSKTHTTNKEAQTRQASIIGNKMLIRLGVRDSSHIGNYTRRNTKAFTWTNAHDDHTMIQTRIDRIYIPLILENKGGTTEILPTILDISDHAGVVLHSRAQEGEKLAHPSSTKAYSKIRIARPCSLQHGGT